VSALIKKTNIEILYRKIVKSGTFNFLKVKNLLFLIKMFLFFIFLTGVLGVAVNITYILIISSCVLYIVNFCCKQSFFHKCFDFFSLWYINASDFILPFCLLKFQRIQTGKPNVWIYSCFENTQDFWNEKSASIIATKWRKLIISNQKEF